MIISILFFSIVISIFTNSSKALHECPPIFVDFDDVASSKYKKATLKELAGKKSNPLKKESSLHSPPPSKTLDVTKILNQVKILLKPLLALKPSVSIASNSTATLNSSPSLSPPKPKTLAVSEPSKPLGLSGRASSKAKPSPLVPSKKKRHIANSPSSPHQSKPIKKNSNQKLTNTKPQLNISIAPQMSLSIIDKVDNKRLLQALISPFETLPYLWWEQCWNDQVHTCSPYLKVIETDLKTYPAPIIESHYHQIATQLLRHQSTAPTRTLLALASILGGLPATQASMHYYLALELLLAMGWKANLYTDLHSRVLNVSNLLGPSGHKVGFHLPYIAKGGFYRLLAAILDLEKVRFRVDSADLQTLLKRAHNQPFVTMKILRRVTSRQLRTRLANNCQNCSLFDSLLRKVAALSLKPSFPSSSRNLCRSNGRYPIFIIDSGLKKVSQKLNRKEQVLLARAVMYFVFKVPLQLTYCPQCNNPKLATQSNVPSLVNAMLECYCRPHSKFQLE